MTFRRAGAQWCLVIALLTGCAGNNVKNATYVDDAPYDPIAARKTDSSPDSSQGAESKVLVLDEIKQLILQKQYPQAEARLRLRLVKSPRDAVAWANLGLVLSETNRVDLAEKALRKAVDINVNFVAAHVRLAAVLKRQGKIQASLEFNKKAIEIDPRNTYAHYNLAILYDLYYEDPVNAYAHLTKYLAETEQDDKEAAVWLKQLRRMVEKQKTAKVDGATVDETTGNKSTIAATSAPENSSE